LNGIEALTPGERRVIRLAADGRSNREIGQELVVTTKTVEMHLRNAYGKLDIASRKDIDEGLREQLRSL
jgi:ATP/maltotriose-dependent transcriptional regulator MalT